MSELKEMEKFVFAPETSRGMASPNVTLLYWVPFEPLMVAVVQPLEPGIVQVEPVKPFAQMQEQAFAERMLVPPLAQGLVC